MSNQTVNLPLSKRAALGAIAGLWLAIATTGCGKTAFNSQPSSEVAAPPGSVTVPGKVDILLVEDDTGSMSEAYDAIAQQVPYFLQSLEQSGWDYHFGVIPLTTYRDFDQAVASRHDSNWGSAWTPAYPGQPSSDPGMLSSSLFRFPYQYTGMISRALVSNAQNGNEKGFANIANSIYYKMYNSSAAKSFHREDALLVIFTLSTGNDTSGVTYVKRSDGIFVPDSATSLSSMNAYANWFKTLRPKNNVKFYSAVSSGQDNCLGNARTFAGDRYIEMSTRLNGQAYDICRTAINAIFANLANEIKSSTILFRTRYVFIDREPDQSTIKVYKNGTLLNKSATDGWTYVGYSSNLNAIDSPVPSKPTTGYAIELHGTARLYGDDTASVDYKASGFGR